MKNQGNIVSQKENDSSPATELKGVEYCGLTDNDFRIAGMKKCSNLQETSESNSVKSGIKLMNWRSTLPKRLVL